MAFIIANRNCFWPELRVSFADGLAGEGRLASEHHTGVCAPPQNLSFLSKRVPNVTQRPLNFTTDPIQHPKLTSPFDLKLCATQKRRKLPHLLYLSRAFNGIGSYVTHTNWVMVLFALLTFLCVNVPAEAVAADAVRAKGRVMFVDSDGKKKPLAFAQVRLMDSDSDYDEEIARGFTDGHGNYDLSGVGGDKNCPGCSAPDPYVKVVLKHPGRLDVHDILHFTRNMPVTPIRKETVGKLDFGTTTYPTEYPEGMAAILYAHALKTYGAFKTISGDSKLPGNDGELAIEIPVVINFGTPYTTWDTIHWPGVYMKYGGIDHEFGHRLRHAIDGNVSHFNGDAVLYQYPRSHTFDEDTNLGFAFNEGWANYFRHEMQPNYLAGTWKGKYKGNEVEGDVAYKLIALSKCGGFKAMWGTLKANPGKIHSFPEFKSAFYALHPECKNRFHSDNLGGVPVTDLKPRSNLPEPQPQAIDISGQAEARERFAANLDRRASRIRWDRAKRIPAAIPAPSRPVVERLSNLRITAAQRRDADARATYRRIITTIPPMTETNLHDDSYERAVEAARREFRDAILEPRQRDVQQLRTEIAQERDRADNEPLRAYLKQLDDKYVRLERALSLAHDQPGPVDIPIELLPHSFVMAGE